MDGGAEEEMKAASLIMAAMRMSQRAFLLLLSSGFPRINHCKNYKRPPLRRAQNGQGGDISSLE